MVGFRCPTMACLLPHRVQTMSERSYSSRSSRSLKSLASRQTPHCWCVYGRRFATPAR